ncbi:MAG: PAS domain-containing protein [Planctomycetes bacterium]|nr:PAS domain-containing protein [Planctomycetota bacterium]
MTVRSISTAATIVILLMMVQNHAVGDESAVKKVLILHSYNPENEYSRLQELAIRESIASNYPGAVFYRIEFLDLRDATQQADVLPKWIDALLAKYKNAEFDLIVTTDTPAVELLTGPMKGLLPSTPIVFSGLSRMPAEVDRSIRPMTGVVETVEIGETARLALKLHPSAKSLVVVSDQTGQGQRLTAIARSELQDLSQRTSIKWLIDSSNKQVLDEAATLSPDDIILLLGQYDEEGRRLHDPESVYSSLCRIANAPIYCCYDVFIGSGIIGGKVASGRQQGIAAGALAARVLNGHRADEIPINAESPNRYIFDWRALNRWNIKQRDLPAGSIIQFHDLTFFERNKRAILVGIGCFVLEALIIIALLISRKLHLRAERRLRFQRDLLETILDVTPVGVMMISSSGHITYVNKQIENETGSDRSEFINRRIDDTAWEVLDNDGNRLQPEEYPVAIVLRTGKPIYHWEGMSRRIRGPLRLRSTSVIPIGGEEVGARGVLVVTQDITEQRRNEESLRQAKEDLELRVRERTSELLEANRALRNAIRERHAAELESLRRQDQLAHVQRLATMGEMATGLAHEINSPLSAIVAYTKGCIRRLNGQNINIEELRNALGEVSSQAHRAGEIIRRLRAFLKKEKPQNTSVHINNVIRNAIGVLQTELRNTSVQVRTELADGIPPVQADPIQLEQVAINLIHNAIDAVKSCSKLPNEVVVATRFDSTQQVIIEVADDGPGILPEHRDRIFEPFFTTKETGLGMGLPISRSIIEAHGGGMEIISWRESGTMIRITLPVAFAGHESTRSPSGPELDLTQT